MRKYTFKVAVHMPPGTSREDARREIEWALKRHAPRMGPIVTPLLDGVANDNPRKGEP